MRILKLSAAAVPAIARDCAGLAGAGLMLYGIAEIYRPAAYVAGGLMLIALALLLAKPRARR